MRGSILACLLALAPRVAHPAVFTVDRFDDGSDEVIGDGICSTDGGGCTLRAAIMEANADEVRDVIALPFGTHRLTLGDLDVSSAIDLRGDDMYATIVEAASADRLLEFHAGHSMVSFVTLRGGDAGDGAGGAILVANGATLSCTRCLIRDNRAAIGGGLAVAAGGLVGLSTSIVASNEASNGGGIYSAGDVRLQLSRLTRNLAVFGGGCYSEGASSRLTLEFSTVDENRAGTGGGVLASSFGALSAVNATVSGNRAARGAGLSLFAVNGSAVHTTVASNLASEAGGGVLLEVNAALAIENTILADNAAPSTPDCSGGALTSVHGHNLVENGACTLSGAANVVGQDPQLLPLANYGGFTPTHELSSASSPAFDQGADASCAPAAKDQREHPRPRGAHCEIGATEFFGIVPLALEIDPFANGVFDETESVPIWPVMASLLTSPASLSGQLLVWSGPPGGYPIDDANASYGSILPGFAASCAAQNNCYALRWGLLQHPPHTDGEAWEQTSGPLRAIWRIHHGASFEDVRRFPAHPAYAATEALLHHEATRGCADGRFCPDDPLTRRQLALLIERSRWGRFLLPHRVSAAEFADVPVEDPYAPWISRLRADGVSAGCTTDPDGAGPLLPRFCPDGPVHRDQLARHLVRMKLGPSFTPPACEAQSWADVAPGEPSCPWIRSATTQGFLAACAADPDGGGPLLPRFCPQGATTRSEAARALGATFGLEVWSLGL